MYFSPYLCVFVRRKILKVITADKVTLNLEAIYNNGMINCLGYRRDEVVFKSHNNV